MEKYGRSGGENLFFGPDLNNIRQPSILFPPTVDIENFEFVYDFGYIRNTFLSFPIVKIN